MEIAAVAGGEGEDDEFGGVVGVEGEDEFFEGSEAGTGGFEEEQDFGTGFDFVFPMVVGFDLRNQIGAGNQFGFERCTGEAAGGF